MLRVEARPGASRCPYCHDDLRDERTWRCPSCETQHHQECARLNGGCTLAGCDGVLSRRPEEAPEEGPSGRAIALALAVLVVATVALAAFLVSVTPETRWVAVEAPPRKAVTSAPIAPRPVGPVRSFGQPRVSLEGDAPSVAVAANAYAGDEVVVVRGRAIETYDATGRRVRERALAGEVTAAAFTSDASTLVYATREEPGSRLYRMRLDGREVGANTLLGSLKGRVDCVALSANGRRAGFASDRAEVVVWDLEANRRVRDVASPSFELPGPATVALSPDGGHALTIVPTINEARVWDLAEGEFVARSDARAGAFVPGTSSTLILRSGVEGLSRWEWRTGAKRPTRTPGSAGTPTWLVVSPDGRRAVEGEVGGVVVFDLSTGDASRARVPNLSNARSVTFDAPGRRLLLGGDVLHEVDLATGRTTRAFAIRTDAVTSLAFAPGQGLLVGRADGRIALLNAAGERVPTIHPLGRHEKRVEAMATASGRVVSASADGTVRVWRASSGELLESIGSLAPVRAVAIERGPGERVLLGDASGRVVLREQGSSSVGRVLWHGPRAIVSVVPLEGRDVAASLDDGGRVTVHAASGSTRTVVERARAIASAGDALVIARTDGTLELRRDRTVTVVAGGSTVALAAHPEGRYVAAAGLDGVVRLLDIEEATIVAQRSVDRVVTALVFADDRLFAGTATGEVVVVDAPLRR